MSEVRDLKPSRPRPSAALASSTTLPKAGGFPKVAQSVVAIAAIAGSVLAISLDGGGYALTSRNTIAVCVLWLLAVGVATGFWPRSALPTACLWTGVCLVGFVAWIGLSGFWAPSPEDSFNEFGRAILYLAVFTLAVVSTAGRDGLRSWRRGIGIGIAGVGLLALASRLFPDSFVGAPALELAQLSSTAASRIHYPVGYWNSLATLVALGVPCLLWAATSERRALARGLFLAPIPALAATLYLTSSRGGMAAAATGVGVFVVLTLRWRAFTAVVLATAGSLAAVLVVVARDAVTAGLLSPGAVTEGRSAALWIILACLLTGAAHGAISSIDLRFASPAKVPGWAVVVVALVAVGAGIAASNPDERLARFKAVPSSEENATLESHLGSDSGNGRWQLWESAFDQFDAHKVTGEGAGTYEAWWAQNGTLGLSVRDAHSIFLETLGELGIVGFLLLVGVLAFGLAVGLARSLRGGIRSRVAPAALTGALSAWILEAGIDWMWESTVVTLVAFACLGLLVGPATSNVSRPMGKRGPRRIALRLAAPVLAVTLTAAVGIPLLAQVAVERSQAAVRAGEGSEALDAAAAAQRVQPWASTPHLQRALVEELLGDLSDAQRAIDRALEIDSSKWRLWLIDARIETKLGNIRAAERSLRRAVALNPRSSRFRGLPGAIEP